MSLPERDQELIQITDASWSDAARRAGEHLVCRPGCTQCCHGAFRINALDVARLQAGMEHLRAADPEAAAHIERRAHEWIDDNASIYPGDAVTGVISDSEADCERFDALPDEAPCPALDPVTGLCQVYAWRPMTCRVFGPPVRMEAGALGCCELCFTEASEDEIAACEMAVAHHFEAALLEELRDRHETVVAYALLKSPPHGTR